MKRCPCCEELLPLSDFHRNRTRSDGVSSTCKTCFSARRWERKRAQSGPRDDTGKTCPRCQDFHPWERFGKNAAAGDGYQTYCKPCSSELARQSRERHAEAIAARQAERLARTPESGGVKLCRKCWATKPLIDFYRHRSTKDGRANYCAECQRAATRSWRERHPGAVDSMNDQRRATTAGREADKRNLRRWWLKLYGLTEEQYDALLAEQNGVCAICLCAETVIDKRSGLARRLSVDHDHKTGAVRGLLCGACNQAIGLLRDDVAVLERAARYLAVT